MFEHEQVSELAFYFGIIPLAVVLLLIYGLSFVTYRLSQQAISPIVRLGKYLADFDFNADTRVSLDLDPLRGSADSEVLSMIDAMDHHIGRLITYLEKTGQYDNTVFVFTSDNGPEGSDAFDELLPLRIYLKLWMKNNGYNQDFETLGTRGSYINGSVLHVNGGMYGG